MAKKVKYPTKINGIRVVNDINDAIKELENKRTIARFEFGESMSPILKNGEYAIVTPIQNISDVKIGDAVLCEVNGYPMTHMVLMKSNSGSEPFFLIGSSHFEIYGWTNKIYGIAHGTDVCEEEDFFEN